MFWTIFIYIRIYKLTFVTPIPQNFLPCLMLCRVPARCGNLMYLQGYFILPDNNSTALLWPKVFHRIMESEARSESIAGNRLSHVCMGTLLVCISLGRTEPTVSQETRSADTGTIPHQIVHYSVPHRSPELILTDTVERWDKYRYSRRCFTGECPIVRLLAFREVNSLRVFEL